MKTYSKRLTALTCLATLIAGVTSVSLLTAIGNSLPEWISAHRALQIVVPVVLIIHIPTSIWLLARERRRNKSHDLKEDLFAYVVERLSVAI